MLATKEALVAQITARERQYIVLVCRVPEPSQAEIAQLMGKSRKTVETHRAKVYRKLGVHTRLELYLKSVQLEILPCACKGRGTGGTTEEP